MEQAQLRLYPAIEHILPVTSEPKKALPQPPINTPHPQAVLENAFKAIFPQNSEQENNVIRIRKILGKTAQTLSDAQIETIVSEFQFLTNAWLDEFEKEIFSGLTLKEVINQT